MTKEKLLIIEDEPAVAKQLKWSLGHTYDISIAGDPEEARHCLATGKFPVATLDLGLPPTPDTPREGLKLLEELSKLSPHIKIIVITGNAEKETAVKAVGLGAADFCAKPIDLKELEIILSRTFRLYALEEANRQLLKQIDQSGTLCGIIGISPVMRKVFSLIRKVSETDYPVLITGDSGTGKEMVAHAIHSLSSRRQKPFVIINCGAIPENLLESELFGHEKGAFTGAVVRKTGKFEQADTGTVFLDEIGDLPLAMQVKILRFLQEGTVERVGGKDVLSLNTRIIAATNVDLEKAVKSGGFREDLYFRMNVVPVHLPLLKERPEDILLLAQNFLRTETQSLAKAGRISFSPGALAALSAHEWPGNVRELQNRIRRALSIFSGQTILPDDLGLEACQVNQADSETFYTLQETRNQAEQNCIRKALMLTGNNISQAARILEVSRPTLHDLLKKHGIST